MILTSRGVGAIDIASIAIQIGGTLLTEGLRFGTVAYQQEFTRRMANLSHQQQLELASRQTELALLLSEQAARHERERGETAQETIRSTASSLGPWLLGAAALVLLGRR
jgi:hypothetical protein